MVLSAPALLKSMNECVERHHAEQTEQLVARNLQALAKVREATDAFQRLLDQMEEIL